MRQPVRFVKFTGPKNIDQLALEMVFGAGAAEGGFPVLRAAERGFDSLDFRKNGFELGLRLVEKELDPLGAEPDMMGRKRDNERHGLVAGAGN